MTCLNVTEYLFVTIKTLPSKIYNKNIIITFCMLVSYLVQNKLFKSNYSNNNYDCGVMIELLFVFIYNHHNHHHHHHHRHRCQSNVHL